MPWDQLDEKGRRYQSAAVELGPLVVEIRAELDADAPERKIDWRIGPLPAVQGDAGLLRLVFTNLLANAVKYSGRQAQAVIEVGASRSGSEEVVCVRDNGVGFDMKYQHKLFGVFQRLHREDEFEGTGIGLATVRRIVNRHDGRTWAEGALGEGAAFYVALPPAEAAAIEEAA